jgi:hypothetical protein
MNVLHICIKHQNAEVSHVCYRPLVPTSFSLTLALCDKVYGETNGSANSDIYMSSVTKHTVTIMI